MKKYFLITTAIAIVFLTALFTFYDNTQADDNPATLKDNIDHSSYNTLLQAHVDDNGRVDYKKLKSNIATLDSYLEDLAKTDPSKFATKNEQLAFWINAYNAYTLKNVLKHLPEDDTKWKKFSVKKVSGFWTRDTHHVAGKHLTLDHMEHKIIRPIFKDPRAHFAIVCASGGCPTLQAKAFIGEGLDAQLTAAATTFFNNTEKCSIDLKNKKIKVSKILKWFKSDFTDHSGTLQQYISQYITDEKIKISLLNDSYSISYLGYDWNLNLQ